VGVGAAIVYEGEKRGLFSNKIFRTEVLQDESAGAACSPFECVIHHSPPGTFLTHEALKRHCCAVSRHAANLHAADAGDPFVEGRLPYLLSTGWSCSAASESRPVGAETSPGEPLSRCAGRLAILVARVGGHDFRSFLDRPAGLMRSA